MLHLVAVCSTRSLDRRLTFDPNLAATMSFNMNGSVGPVRVFGKTAPTSADLPAVAEHLDPVGIREFHGMVIKDLAIVLVVAALAARK